MSASSEFINGVKEGAYASKTNAQRAIGVWSRHNKWGSAAEMKRAKEFVEGFTFSGVSAAPKPGKKASKKVAKKAAKKVGKKAGKKVGKKAGKKKVTRRASQEETPQGALGSLPATVKTVGDILRVVDSTVASGVRTLDALRQAKDLSSEGDISAGVESVKRALIGIGSILNEQVVSPLSATYSASPQDVAVAERLSQVVAATDDLNAAAAAQTSAYVPPPMDSRSPPLPPPPVQ